MSEERLDKLEEKIDNLRENHLVHLAANLTEVQTDVSWLKSFFWIIAGASIAGLLTGLINLIIK